MIKVIKGLEPEKWIVGISYTEIFIVSCVVSSLTLTKFKCKFKCQDKLLESLWMPS